MKQIAAAMYTRRYWAGQGSPGLQRTLPSISGRNRCPVPVAPANGSCAAPLRRASSGPVLRVCVLLGLLLFLSACADTLPLEAQRTRLAQETHAIGGPVRIAVVWNAEHSFFDGARLAEEEINARGGIAGRPLELIYHDENPFLEQARVDRVGGGAFRNAFQRAASGLARAVSDDPSVIAVVGHSPPSYTTLPAEVTYQERGLLMLGAEVSTSRVEHPLSMRMLSLVNSLADEIAGHAARLGWNEIYMINSIDHQDDQMAQFLRKSFGDYGVRVTGGISIVARDDKISPSSSRRVTEAVAGDVRGSGIDALFVISGPVSSAEVVRRIRRMGISQPIVVLTGLDPRPYIAEVGVAGDQSIVLSIFDDSGYLAQRFTGNFLNRFGYEPNADSALAYDSIQLLAEAIVCAGSSEPNAIAATLRYNMDPWIGVTGTYDFGADGINLGKRYGFMLLQRTPGGQLQARQIDLGWRP